MGHVVTLTAAEVTLGPVPGASFQMRVGDTPSLADLPEVAVATNTSGPMGVRFAAALHARYVLIWFTALPPVGLGTYQASVYNVTLLGASSRLAGKHSSMSSCRVTSRRTLTVG